MCPRRSSDAAGPCLSILCALLLVSLLGCDTVPLGSNADLQALSSSRELAPFKELVIEEPIFNDDFASAQPATLPPSGSFTIQGTIDGVSDVDLYALGPAVAGDMITIDVTGHNGLNTVAALFDAAGNLIDANNDRSYYAGNLDPYINQPIRRNTDNLFLGIAVSSATHFASNSGRYDAGSYSVRLTRRTDMSYKAATRQVVWLDFEGGDRVQVALEPFEDMRPFSAESISGRLTGQTDYLIDLVVAHLRHDLTPFNVVVLSSRHDARPAQPYSTLYFGNFNSAFLGLADNVDTGNLFMQQKAIIYTETINLFESLLPSAEAVAQAIGNIAAHELGHLLGLEHCGNPLDVMSTAASARQILEIDATYVRSALHRTIFPVGWQDGYDLLMLNVGSSADGSARARMQDFAPASTIRIDPALGDIEINMCGRCPHGGCPE